MSFSLIYIINQLFYRIFIFLKHWDVSSFYIFWNFIISFLSKLDRIFAVKISLRYLFHPLYQDYSVIGYILGFIFRLIRIFIGSIIYLLILLIAGAVYLTWLAAPVFLIYKILYILQKYSRWI